MVYSIFNFPKIARVVNISLPISTAASVAAAYIGHPEFYAVAVGLGALTGVA